MTVVNAPLLVAGAAATAFGRLAVVRFRRRREAGVLS